MYIYFTDLSSIGDLMGYIENSMDNADIYGDSREALLDEDSLTAMEEAFMQGWDEALEDKNDLE